MPRWLVWTLVLGGFTWAQEESTLSDPADQEMGPHLRHSMTSPVTRIEGEDVLVTCVARNVGENTVIFKYSPGGRTRSTKARQVRTLTANLERITSDDRFSVLHEEGGDVYVLVLKNSSISDSGMYICELNTDPLERSFHKVTILPIHTTSTPYTIMSNTSSAVTQDSLDAWGYSTEKPITHDYSSCCSRMNVSQQCQPFCNLKNILDGATGVDPGNCETEFPSIVSCMADGRDHMDCCIRVGIPDVCTDLCRGEYTKVTDNVKTHFSCAAYTAPTLTCISVGIELLPGRPENFAVETLNETAINVKWSPATNGHENTKVYYINTTFIQYLSPVFSASVDKVKTKSIQNIDATIINSVHTDIAADLPTQETIVGLKPFSLYEVSMWAENSAKGKSLKTYTVKIVTHIVGDSSPVGPLITPDIPDIKSCCIERNVSHAPCVDKFCDARGIGSVQVSDLMICAPWDTEMFSCLADGKDHTPCCAAKNLPSLCQNLCSGNVTDINFKYFRCLTYMDELSSCMLEGYGVLPSAPINFRFSNIDTSFGILHWDPPSRLGESVVDYRVILAPISLFKLRSRIVRKIIPHAKSPFILEGLQSSTSYEVFIEPVNQHGIGESSNKIVFRTADRDLDQLLEDQHPYNQTNCCIKSGVKPECQILCSYNARMSDIKALSSVCASSFSKVTRCAAGGRDHLPCCMRRGVPKNCQPLCQAVHQASTGAEFKNCLPFIGQIYTCYEEGTLKLPPAVRELRAITVEDEKVVLAWVSEDVNGTFETTDFQVYYKRLEINATTGTVFDHDKEFNVTVPRAEITELVTGFQYRFFVVSRNEYGTSLPSAIVTLTVSSASWNGTPVKGATSPPHLLEVATHSATFLELAWNPPAITHPEDQIKYTIFYRQLSSSLPAIEAIEHMETDITNLKIPNLNPNTQYSLHATAIIIKNGSLLESEPSETLLAWTDPAFPAFVEAPTIHPINMVREGTSMTVLCIAMGTPKPTVTLYIAGHPIHSDVTRHMVTVIHNVTREMGDVSCYADNGYGTPMQASRRITISRSPTVSSPPSTSVAKSNTVLLKCKVDAYPAPTITVFRDRQFRQSIGNSDRVSLVATGDSQNPASYTLEMTITDLAEEDGGLYYCHANNSLGEAFAVMGLNVTTIPPAVMNVTSCCVEQNVSSSCLDICTFSIDFDEILRKPHCIPEFHRLMNCASDGSDHRHCCSKSGVPGQCLDWCRGEPVTESEVCAVSNSKVIVGCFHEGRTHLPGPPRNIRVRPIDSTSVTVTWDLPEKNPDTVELYRVFWRPIGDKKANKNDTSDTKLKISQLITGRTYELVVKAGNSNGTSQLTAPLKFITADEFIIPTSSHARADVGGAVGIVLAVFLVIGVILLVIFVMKKKNLILLSVKKPESPTVAFENPFYAREPQANPQILQEDYNVRISSSGSWNSEMSNGPNTQEQQTSPHNNTPDNIESEADPSFYEEMKLGRGGQGFKRLR